LLGLNFSINSKKVSAYLQPLYIVSPKATEFRNISQNTEPLHRSRSFQVTDFGTNRKAYATSYQ